MFPDEFYRKLVLILEAEKSAEDLTESDGALLQEWTDYWQSLVLSTDDDKEVA